MLNLLLFHKLTKFHLPERFVLEVASNLANFSSVHGIRALPCCCFLLALVRRFVSRDHNVRLMEHMITDFMLLVVSEHILYCLDSLFGRTAFGWAIRPDSDKVNHWIQAYPVGTVSCFADALHTITVPLQVG